jgi:hypothetical protein
MATFVNSLALENFGSKASHRQQVKFTYFIVSQLEIVSCLFLERRGIATAYFPVFRPYYSDVCIRRGCISYGMFRQVKPQSEMLKVLNIGNKEGCGINQTPREFN